jgi:DeoD family purine-nucleoside phosphorylase
MPIHIRAEPGEYAEAVLLPGDPLRAKYIAETYFDDSVQRNAERGLLGFSGTWKGKPISVQGTGMGCPGATIVFEELIQLGCKKLIRVGTCGGLDPNGALGDLIVALSAVPAESTALHLVGKEPPWQTASLWLYTDNVDQAWKRAVDAGGKTTMPLTDMFWGDRLGQITDPFGNKWNLAQHMKDLTPDELKKAQDAFVASMKK